MSDRVIARGAAGIESVVNPTLLPQSRSQSPNSTTSSVFSTYGADSAVSIRAVSGDVVLSNDIGGLTTVFSSINWNATNDASIPLRVYAPTLSAASIDGDLFLNGDITLFPSTGGSVTLFANRDVTRLNPDVFVRLTLSDADPAYLPSIDSPRDPSDTSRIIEVLESATGLSANLHAVEPLHGTDDERAHIVARLGDVSLLSSGESDTSLLYFSAPARIVAGRDLIDIPLTAQHHSASAITSLVAGRDLRYTVTRNASGGIDRNGRAVEIDGAGTLQLQAGRDVDLQTARGISTRGNLVNPNLPHGGADISVLAGLNGRQLAYDETITRYLELGAGYATDLVAYVEARTGETDLAEQEARDRLQQLARYREDLSRYVAERSGRNDLTQTQALELFRGYTRADQRVLLERVLFSELRFSGRAAATSGSGDFRRGFAALETLFPGANPDSEAGEANGYAGDIALYFSRIYALDGGNISLLAPGGEINVGLAAPPSAFGLTKRASDLGIVVQGAGSVNALGYRDFQVNESRVFASDGGDILVWSTDGDIDAGRGAKTAISAPPPVISFDPATGAPIVTFPPALTGSGIQTLATSSGVEPGDVDLFAPRGVVNAGDAGIVAGNLTIAATAVLGADNIQVSGVAVGVPVDTGGLGASLSGVSNVASGAANAATTSVGAGERQTEKPAALADAALSWLDVFVIGLGEEQCDPQNMDCLKRQGPRDQ